MAIPNPQAAKYNSLNEFIGQFKDNDNFPSTTNLFSLHFSCPAILRSTQTQVSGTFAGQTDEVFNPERGDLRNLLLDYYAKAVNLPSKQVTSGQIVNVGSGFKYATGTAFSQINITFQVPRSQYTRNFFERWVDEMARDSNQFTEFYREYVCPRLYIFKMERGGGDLAISDPKLLSEVRRAASQGLQVLTARKNDVTACWELQNVFPYNIGSIQLNNDKARVMELTVGFYYERYRFFTKDQFDSPGRPDIVLDMAETSDNIIDTNLV